jgi:hypothetical protein
VTRGTSHSPSSVLNTRRFASLTRIGWSDEHNRGGASILHPREQHPHFDQVVAAVKVKTQSTNAPPRCRSFRKPPTVFIQPKTYSISLRFRWLTS